MKFLPSLFLLSFLFSSFLTYSQEPSKLNKQADSLYHAGDFALSGEVYEELLQEDSTLVEAYHRRGTCYLQLEKPILAESYLQKAIQIDSNYAKSYYNLGLIRVQNEQHKEGLAFFKSYYQLEPQDSEGVYNIAFAFAALSQKDSFDTYFQLGLELDGNLLFAYEHGPDTYLLFGQHGKAEYVIEKGLLQFPDEAILYKEAISIYEQLGKQHKALDVYQRAKEQFPTEISWYHGVAIKRIQANTAPEVLITSDEETRKFRSISVRHIEEMDARVTDKKGNYRYADLLKKWQKTPREMALDEYFMLYYGFSKQKDFDPTASASYKQFETFQAFLEEEDDEEALDAIEAAIQLTPSKIDYYYWKASCLASLEDYDRFEMAIQDYYGFALSILNSGDGTSFETAYVTTNQADKFSIMELLDLKVSDTMDVEYEGKSFIILVDQEEEVERKVCFWVKE